MSNSETPDKGAAVSVESEVVPRAQYKALIDAVEETIEWYCDAYDSRSARRKALPWAEPLGKAYDALPITSWQHEEAGTVPCAPAAPVAHHACTCIQCCNARTVVRSEPRTSEVSPYDQDAYIARLERELVAATQNIVPASSALPPVDTFLSGYDAGRQGVDPNDAFDAWRTASRDAAQTTDAWGHGMAKLAAHLQSELDKERGRADRAEAIILHLGSILGNQDPTTMHCAASRAIGDAEAWKTVAERLSNAPALQEPRPADDPTANRCVMCVADVASFCVKCAASLATSVAPNPPSDDGGWNDATRASLARMGGISMCECGFPHGHHMPDCPCFAGPVPCRESPSPKGSR